MTVLDFSLSPAATRKIHDILQCLAKFGESVSLEARDDKLSLTTLNTSRTAYASFALESKVFFLSYRFAAQAASQSSFTCQLYNKALSSAFHTRSTDVPGTNTNVDHCDVSVDEQPDKTECRILIRTVCKHGVTKTFKLTYESTETMHALFDKTAATNGWKISSRILREYIEYFGPKTEQLDMVAKEGKAVFTSFREKVMDGREILKQPLETAISIHTEDFDEFRAEDDTHIVISVRDFKAVVTHAETVQAALTARFSRPSRPLQFSYETSGIRCEYVLMTAGDYRDKSTQGTPNPVASRAPSTQTRLSTETATQMPPPARPTATQTRLQRRPLSSLNRGALSAPSQSSQSLFVSNDEEDDDKRWDAPDFEHEQAEDSLGWDASGEMNTVVHPTIRDTGSHAPSTRTVNSFDVDTQGLEPTQRLSQLHALFD